MNYSLIIPIYNEEKTLIQLLSQLEDYADKIEVIIVNDGSTDKTKLILEKQTNYKIIHNPYNKGKGSSIIIGSKSVTNDNIILMDGDLEINLICIKDLIQKYESLNKQVVVGNRWLKKTNVFDDLNTYGNYFFNYIFNLLYDTQLKDILCCIKILDKNLFKSLKLKSKRFNIEVELMSKLAFNRVKIFEVQVPYKRRTNEQGKKLKISDGLGILLKMIKIRFKWD